MEHYCKNINRFPLEKFLQKGIDRGKTILIVGEAPAPNGWRKSGKAFYTIDGKLLPTGKNLNKLLYDYNLSVEVCGFTELVKCYVEKDRKLLDDCGIKCWPIFKKQLKSSNYSLIILLGVKTLEIFNKNSNNKIKIGKLTKTKIDNKNYILLPIYHPSPIAPFNHKRNQEIFSQLKIKLNKLI